MLCVNNMLRMKNKDEYLIFGSVRRLGVQMLMCVFII